MRIKEEVKEHWKQPVKPSDAWKTILFAMLLIGGILAFGQVIFHSRFERLGWAILLLVIWTPTVKQLVKHGWRVLQNYQGLFFVGYTFFAGGNILPQGRAASWLTSIGALLLIGAGIFMLVDFRKTKQPVSTDTVPPM